MSNFGGLQAKSGNYVKWPQVGASVTGVVLKAYVDIPNFDDAVECPHLLLQTAEGEKVLSATQTALYNLLLEREAEITVGSTVTITYSGTSGNAKLFTLEVTAPAGAPGEPTEVPPATPQAATPQAAPAEAAVGQAPPIV